MKLILIIYLSILPFEILATGQVLERLINGKDTFYIVGVPLQEYFEKKGEYSINGVSLRMSSTACYRGYKGTWEIRNDSLFLTKLSNGCHNYPPVLFDLESEFGDSVVHAYWYSGKMMSPRGNILQVNEGGHSIICEKEKTYIVENGIITSTNLKHNVIQDISLLYPGEYYLKETLEKMILENLSTISLDSISTKRSCEIFVDFNKEGLIDTIVALSMFNDSVLTPHVLKCAMESFKGLPRLMKLTHKYYSEPNIIVEIRGRKENQVQEKKVTKNRNNDEANQIFINNPITILTIIIGLFTLFFVMKNRKTR